MAAAAALLVGAVLPVVLPVAPAAVVLAAAAAAAAAVPGCWCSASVRRGRAHWRNSGHDTVRLPSALRLPPVEEGEKASEAPSGSDSLGPLDPNDRAKDAAREGDYSLLENARARVAGLGLDSEYDPSEH